MTDSSSVEIWVDAHGFPGYQVSNLGRVKSMPRQIIRKNGRPHTTKEKLLKIHQDTRGYPQVTLYYYEELSKPGKRSPQRVHRLVFQSFVRPLAPGEHCHHLDSDPLNPCLDNLEAVSGHLEHWQHTWGRIFKEHYDKGYQAGLKAGRDEGYEDGYFEGGIDHR